MHATRRCRSSRARPAGACGSPTARCRRSRSRARRAAPAASVGDGARARFPALADARRGVRPGRAPRRGPLRRHVRRRRSTPTRRGRPAARAAAVRARADQVARRGRRPGAGARGRRRASRRPAIPLGWVLLDNPWETCVGTLAFDRARIPDPAGLIRQVHARGVRFMLWISPKAIVRHRLSGRRACSARPSNQMLDLRQPTVVARLPGAAAQARRARDRRRQGRPRRRGRPRGRRARRCRTTTRCSTRSAVMGALPPGAGAIFRAGDGGVAGRAAGALGRRPARRVRSASSAAIAPGRRPAMSGFPTWGSDVGGYSSEALTGEVFARWAQLGAVSPMLEVGGARRERDAVDARRRRRWRRCATRRSSTTSSSRTSTACSGADEPVLRPLGYALPGRPAGLGRRPRAARRPRPARGAGRRRRARRRASTCPQGDWVDLYAGAAVRGGRVFTRADAARRSSRSTCATGAVVPFNLRTQTDSWWGVTS